MNPPDTPACLKCELPAYASGKAIAEKAESLQATAASVEPEMAKEKHFANDWALFFPEGVLAVLVLLALPIWVGSLLAKGANGAALSLSFLAVSGFGVGIFAWRKENKWLLYLGVMLVLFGAWSAL